MKKLFGICLIFFFTCSLKAQVKKDTMQVDSSQIEKIKKMPMDDTLHHKMPTKPVLPEEQKKNGSTDEPIQQPRKEK